MNTKWSTDVRLGELSGLTSDITAVPKSARCGGTRRLIRSPHRPPAMLFNFQDYGIWLCVQHFIDLEDGRRARRALNVGDLTLYFLAHMSNNDLACFDVFELGGFREDQIGCSSIWPCQYDYFSNFSSTMDNVRRARPSHRRKRQLQGRKLCDLYRLLPSGQSVGRSAQVVGSPMRGLLLHTAKVIEIELANARGDLCRVKQTS